MTTVRLDAALGLGVAHVPTVYLFRGPWVIRYQHHGTAWTPDDRFAAPVPITTWWPSLIDTDLRTGFEAAWRPPPQDDDHRELWLTRGNNLTVLTYDTVDPHRIVKVDTSRTLSGTVNSLAEDFRGGIDAAASTTDRAYLFKGNQYCSYTESSAEHVQTLKGIDHVDAAAAVPDGESSFVLYLFTDDSYHTAKVDDDTGMITVTAGSTKITETWPAAPLGTPVLDIYHYEQGKLTRTRTNIDLSTHTTPLPDTVTVTKTTLGHTLDSEPVDFRFFVTPDSRRACVPVPAGTGTSVSWVDLTGTGGTVLWSQPAGTQRSISMSYTWDTIWASYKGNAGKILRLRPAGGSVTPASGPTATDCDWGTAASPADPGLPIVYVTTFHGIGPVNADTLNSEKVGTKQSFNTGEKMPRDPVVTADGKKLFTVFVYAHSQPCIRRFSTDTPDAADVAGTESGNIDNLVGAPDGQHVVATDHGNRTIVVVDTKAEYGKSINADKPVGRAAVDPLSRHAYVPVPESGELLIVDLDSPKAIGKVTGVTAKVVALAAWWHAMGTTS